MVLGVPGRVVTRQRPPAAQIDRPRLVDRTDPLGWRRQQLAEQLVQLVAVDHPRAGHQPGRVGEVPGAAFMHDDLRARVRLRQVADSAGVIEMDVRDHDRRQILPGRLPARPARRRTTGADGAVPVSTRHGRSDRIR